MTNGGWNAGLGEWAVAPIGAAVAGREPGQRGRHARSRQARSGLAPFKVPPVLDEQVLADGWTTRLAGRWLHTSDRFGGARLATRTTVRPRLNSRSVLARPTNDVFHIAVISMKGGVGKTTTTLCLGSLLAANRTDRIIAIDAGPDRGTLASRVQQGPQAPFTSLLAEQPIERYSEMRAYTRITSGHLEVLGGEQDPSVVSEFTGAQYHHVVGLAHDYYSVMISDCGTGVTNSATLGALSLAHSVIVVTSPSLDSLKSTAATLKWLTLHGYSNLARESHIVLSIPRPGAPGVRVPKVHDHFQARCRSFHVIPFDRHLADGGVVEVDELSRGATRAYLGLAAEVAQNFGEHGRDSLADVR